MSLDNKELLRIEEISKHFGGLSALDGVTTPVYDGEILGVIGPNGAGKTTLYNVIGGVFKADHGKVTFKGEELTGLKPHKVAKKGVVRTFQANSLVRDATTLENIKFGFYLHRTAKSWGWFFNNKTAHEQEVTIAIKAMQIMERMGLIEVSGELAKNVSHGKQRILGVSIALAAEPKILLMDEPLTGMNHTEKTEMVKIIRGLRDSGLTIVIIEHDMSAVMSLCDRIVVLNYGKKIAEGTPREIQTNQEVITAYLGEEATTTQAV